MRAGSSARDNRRKGSSRRKLIFHMRYLPGPYVPLLHFLRQFEAPISRLIMEAGKHWNEFIEYFINIMSNQGVEWKSAGMWRKTIKIVIFVFWKLSTRAMLLNPVKINKRGEQAFFFLFLFMTYREMFLLLFIFCFDLSFAIRTNTAHSFYPNNKMRGPLSNAGGQALRRSSFRKRLISRKEVAYCA